MISYWESINRIEISIQYEGDYDFGCVPLGWSGSGSVIRDHSDYGRSNEPMNLLWTRIYRVHLIYRHDPSDLGSLILNRIISKESTLSSSVRLFKTFIWTTLSISTKIQTIEPLVERDQQLFKRQHNIAFTSLLDNREANRLLERYRNRVRQRIIKFSRDKHVSKSQYPALWPRNLQILILPKTAKITEITHSGLFFALSLAQTWKIRHQKNKNKVNARKEAKTQTRQAKKTQSNLSFGLPWQNQILRTVLTFINTHPCFPELYLKTALITLLCLVLALGTETKCPCKLNSFFGRN